MSQTDDLRSAALGVVADDVACKTLAFTHLAMAWSCAGPVWDVEESARYESDVRSCKAAFGTAQDPRPRDSTKWIEHEVVVLWLPAVAQPSSTGSSAAGSSPLRSMPFGDPAASRGVQPYVFTAVRVAEHAADVRELHLANCTRAVGAFLWLAVCRASHEIDCARLAATLGGLNRSRLAHATTDASTCVVASCMEPKTRTMAPSAALADAAETARRSGVSIVVHWHAMDHGSPRDHIVQSLDVASKSEMDAAERRLWAEVTARLPTFDHHFLVLVDARGSGRLLQAYHGHYTLEQWVDDDRSLSACACPPATHPDFAGQILAAPVYRGPLTAASLTALGADLDALLEPRTAESSELSADQSPERVSRVAAAYGRIAGIVWPSARFAAVRFTLGASEASL